jgi:hypothetical protein
MGHHSAADLTSQSGYTNYQPIASPDETSKFGGMQAAQINPGLATTLQAQSTGQGPNLAGQQMQQSTQANLASQLAAQASQRGNQNPGEAARNLATNAAATNQQAAGQSAQLAGQQQLNAQSQLGQLDTSQAGLNQQANQYNSQAQQNLAGLQQQQNQFQNQLGYNVQNAQNSADLGFAMANNNAGNQLTQSLSSAGAGAITGAASALAAHGKVIDLPRFATGGVVDSGAQSAGQMQDLLRNLAAYQNFDPPQKFSEAAPTIPNTPGFTPSGGKGMPAGQDYTGKATGTESPNISPGQLSSPVDPNAATAQLQSPELNAANNGYQPSASLMPAMAKGGVLTKPTVLPTANGPVVAGEAGKEAIVPMGSKAAIVPVKGDGTADPKRAVDSNVQALLKHPDFLAALKQATGGMSDRMSALETAIKGKKGAKNG